VAGAEKAEAMGSFGESLRRERDVRGVSLREVAEGTKISVRFLQALEEDRLDVLPGGLFPRAFVRQYALFLGLDPEKVVTDFVAAHGAQPAVPERKLVVIPERGPRLSIGRVFLAAVAVLAVVLTFRHGRESERARLQTPPTTIPAAPAVLPTDRVYPSPELTPTAANPESGGTDGGDGLVLTMTAQQDCWVEVRADGATVINRVLAEGESQRLEARGEIVLSVGNAGGLSIRVNDRPALPLGRAGEVRKNIVITRQNLPSLVQKDGAAAPDGHSG
jgi:cytoskeleton protein RodZ